MYGAEEQETGDAKAEERREQAGDRSCMDEEPCVLVVLPGL